MTTTLTARSPEDLLAVVPVVLGFVPTDSVVMLTFGARSTFHARVDLPAAARRHRRGGRVAARAGRAARRASGWCSCSTATTPLPAERVSRRLVRGFREAGIEVVDVLRADGRRWFPLLAVAPVGAGQRRAVRRHARTRSRPRPWSRATSPTPRATSWPGCSSPTTTGSPGWPRPARTRTARTTRPGCGPRCTGTSATARRPTTRRRPGCCAPSGPTCDARDAAWSELRRDDAKHHVELWTDLLRRAPDDLAGSAAAVLGMAAWVAGHGALAWCAVDRAEAADPDNSLARLVADLLAAAVPPSAWEEVHGMRDPA